MHVGCGGAGPVEDLADTLRAVIGCQADPEQIGKLVQDQGIDAFDLHGCNPFSSFRSVAIITMVTGMCVNV